MAMRRCYGVASVASFTLALICCVSGSLAATCYKSFSKADFPQCQLLAPFYALHWVVKGDNITVAIDADTSNPWIAFGLSEAGGMKGADEWVAYRNSSGAWNVGDYHSLKYAQPLLDDVQNVQLVSAMQEAGQTLVVMRRKLNTCDPQDLQVIAGAPQFAIWATGSYNWPSYHDETKGSVMLRLNDPSAGGQSILPRNAYTINFAMPNYTVPSAATTYVCSIFKVPTNARQHVVAFEGLPSSNLVHHILVYACDREPKIARGSIFDCESMIDECTSMTPMAWAPGVPYTEYPSTAGFAVGKGKGAPVFFAMQVHYTNLEGRSGVRDSSGIKMHLTKTLRPNDLGIFQLGTQFLEIPPGLSSYTNPAGVCPDTCTLRMGRPLKLVATLLHMHTQGKSIITQHIRNGTELRPLGIRSAYDFAHQGLQFIPPNDPTATLMPGDTLITSCTFDSSRSRNTTYWGENTWDEMCYDFLVYYPRLDFIEECTNYTTYLSSCTTSAMLDRITDSNAEAYLRSGDLVLYQLGNYTALDNTTTCHSTAPPPSAPAPKPSPPGKGKGKGKGKAGPGKGRRFSLL